MRSALLVYVLLVLPGALEGQSQSLEAFGEVIDVRVLNLEVAVTDEDDRHVPGLRPADFRLLVDGEEVPIEYFSEIREGSARAGVEPSGDEPSGGPGVAVVPSATPGEIVGTSFLLFVDNFFGHARDRKIVLREIIEQVRGFGPKDRMAVVSFDGRQLDLIGGWSSSPETVAENLRAAMDQRAFGLQRIAELNFFEAELSNLGAGLIQESTVNTVTEYVRKLSRQVTTVVNAATTAMRTMASAPGRKVLLLTSGGWPDDPATYAVGPDNQQIRNRNRDFSPKPAFDHLAGTANLLGYTVYPIDLRGKHHGPGAAEGGARGREVASQSFDPAIGTFMKTSGRESEVEMPMIALARETGGRAMINSFRETVMSRTLDDTGSYYWLGYTPKRQRDDGRHEVRVEVLRPGLTSRSRRSFRDLSRKAEVTMMVESNLLFSTPLSEHSLEVRLGSPKKARRGRIELPISLKIPLDDIVMLPVAGGFEARLELRVAVMNEDGDRSEIPVIPVVLGGATAPPPNAHAIYDTFLRLRRARQRLALALYDLASEKIFSTSIEFDPNSS